MAKNIILIGFMGAGKTVVGKKLAQKLGYQFVDVDREIEKLLQKPIPLIFKKYGQLRFRSEEELMLTKVCQNTETVIATGGGVILKENNRKTIANGNKVIWLQAKPETIMKRVGLGKGRPLLKGKKIEDVVQELLAKRSALYIESAHVKIETDDKNIDQVVEEIIASIKDDTNVP